MKKVWIGMLLACVILPVAVRIIQMQAPRAGQQIVTGIQQMGELPFPLVIGSLVVSLMLSTKIGRRMGRWGSRLGWVFYQVMYNNTRQRLGRFYGLLVFCGWIGLGCLVWWGLHPSWRGALHLVLYWGGLWLSKYLFERYKRWQFLRKFRTPGRLRWSGIGEELRDAGGRWVRFFQHGGHDPA